MGYVEALDRNGDIREVQAASQFVQFDPVAEEPDLDVLSHQVEQVLLLAPLRHDRPDPAAAKVGEVAGDGVVHRFREDHLFRGLVPRVVPGKELLEEPLRLVERVLALPGKRSPVDVEEHEEYGPLAHDVVDDIFVVGLLPVHVLALAQPLEGCDLVAELHRPLVLLPPCEDRHLFPERPDESGDISLQDRLGPLHPLPVLFFADGSRAGGAARTDVSPEARPPGKAPAGPEAEDRL